MPANEAEVAGLVAAADALAAQVVAMRCDWAARLAGWRSEGRQIALWGAGSKAVTFLNIIEGTGAIGHVVDISPDKRGRHIPGTGHRIEAPEEMARAARRPIEVIAMNPLYRRRNRPAPRRAGCCGPASRVVRSKPPSGADSGEGPSVRRCGVSAGVLRPIVEPLVTVMVWTSGNRGSKP